jgi:hypothetical protein
LITHFPNVPTNGFAIQFTTTTDPLDPGNSQVFRFTSADTPSMVTGNSLFFDHPPSRPRSCTRASRSRATASSSSSPPCPNPRR